MQVRVVVNRRLVWDPRDREAVVLASRVVLAGLTREPHVAFGLAFPGFVEPAGATAVD